MRRTHPVLRLDGGPVYLTPLQHANVHTHFRWNNDPELNRLDSEGPVEREAFGDFLKRFDRLAAHPSTTARDFEIHTADSALVGVAFLDHINRHDKRCRVGVTICERSCWGQGLGRAALAALLHHAFVDLGLHRITAESFNYNTAWRRLLASFGFRREGAQRDYLFRDGRYWDKESYALLESEYRRRAVAA